MRSEMDVVPAGPLVDAGVPLNWNRMTFALSMVVTPLVWVVGWVTGMKGCDDSVDNSDCPLLGNVDI